VKYVPMETVHSLVHTKSLGSLVFEHAARGLTSKSPIKVSVFQAAPGSGITFEIPATPGDTSFVRIPAHADYVVNTLRNVVLGEGPARLCIVEHFLAAASLWGVTDLLVRVNGPEMPIGDGSAKIWLDLFGQSGIPKVDATPKYELLEAFSVHKGDREILAMPADQFSISYMMDWDHPRIGKRWATWQLGQNIAEIGRARTFGSLREHEMLGLQNDVVSLTPEGFSMPLHFDDEPVHHKLLDLLGDLALVGVNPLSLKIRFFSIKGGHELDVELAKKLRSVLSL
jgi:UDP-3-O-[3-hydroxymyristoyl] N-acetylglucosamine deacetylase